jgi:uncharacterized RDD family membrane protein YckC
MVPPMYDAPPAEDWRWFDDDELTGGVISRRIFAWAIDALLISAVCAVLWVALMIFGVLTLGLGLPLLGLLPFVPGLYTFAFIAGPAAATPGEWLMGITVRREDDLGRPTPLQALVWTVGYYVTLAAGAIWLVVALFTVRRRALHDMAAGLMVARRGALTQPAPFWNIPGGSPAA